MYQIRDWDKHFENNKSRERDQCSFVCVPNKQHGLGFSRVVSEKDGSSIYGIWHMILGACSRQRRPRAGWLTQDGHQTGTPWAPEDLAAMFRRPVAEIVRALEFMVSIGWIIDYKDVTEDKEPSARQVPAKCPSGALEEKGSERKGKEENVVPTVVIPDGMKSMWEEWNQHLKEKKVRRTASAIQKQAKALIEMGEERAKAAVDFSIASSYQGIYEPGKSGFQKTKPQEPWQKQKHGDVIRERIKVLENEFQVADPEVKSAIREEVQMLRAELATLNGNGVAH